ncbi:unnamed protein product, partial [Chrysoparadoxa australica]
MMDFGFQASLRGGTAPAPLRSSYDSSTCASRQRKAVIDQRENLRSRQKSRGKGGGMKKGGGAEVTRPMSRQGASDLTALNMALKAAKMEGIKASNRIPRPQETEQVSENNYQGSVRKGKKNDADIVPEVNLDVDEPAELTYGPVIEHSHLISDEHRLGMQARRGFKKQCINTTQRSQRSPSFSAAPAQGPPPPSPLDVEQPTVRGNQ